MLYNHIIKHRHGTSYRVEQKVSTFIITYMFLYRVRETSFVTFFQ